MPTTADAHTASVAHLPDAVALAALACAATRVPSFAFASADLGLFGPPAAEDLKTAPLPFLLASLGAFETLTHPGMWRHVGFSDLVYDGVDIGPWETRLTCMHRWHLPQGAGDLPSYPGLEPDALRQRIGQDIDLLPASLIVGRNTDLSNLSYEVPGATLGPLGMGLTLAAIEAYKACGRHCPPGLVTEVQWLASPLGTSHVFLFHLAVSRTLPIQDTP